MRCLRSQFGSPILHNSQINEEGSHAQSASGLAIAGDPINPAGGGSNLGQPAAQVGRTLVRNRQRGRPAGDT